LGDTMVRTISSFLRSLVEALGNAQMIAATAAVRRIPHSSAIERLRDNPEAYRRLRDY